MKIHYTDCDRTNRDARMLPCKVLESKTVDDFVIHRVYGPSGMIKNCFRGEEQRDMSNTVFTSFNTVDPSSPVETLLIQASWASTG